MIFNIQISIHLYKDLLRYGEMSQESLKGPCTVVRSNFVGSPMSIKEKVFSKAFWVRILLHSKNYEITYYVFSCVNLTHWSVQDDDDDDDIDGEELVENIALKRLREKQVSVKFHPILRFIIWKLPFPSIGKTGISLHDFW